ncbi:MAG: cytochrome b/b6 domain-containing protein [Rubrivivax sp.]
MTRPDIAPASAAAADPGALVAVRVWDLPTRLFHWALATCIVVSVVSAKIGGNAMAWHFRCGYVVLGLLVFRLLWGLVGGHWSRFARFVYAPSTLMRYLRGRAAPHEQLDVGHSPLGALSVFAMLIVLAVQVGTGLVGDDEIASVGPLNRYVSNATGLAATAWHNSWGQWTVIGLVLMHVAAVVLYTLRGRPLVAAMVGGDKSLPAGTPASADGRHTRWLAFGLAAASAAGVVALLVLAG